MPKIMKYTSHFITAALALGAAVTLSAQPVGGPDHGGRRGRAHRPPPDPLVRLLDANHDHVISADEIANAPQALLTLDQNKDGVIEGDELRPLPPPDCDGAPPDDQGPPPPEARDGRGPRRVPPILRALDLDQDGTLSAAEIANASAALLKLDQNGDGQLIVKEFAPRPPRGQTPPKG